MKSKANNLNNPDEEPEEDFPDPSDAELGLAQEAQIVPQPASESPAIQPGQDDGAAPFDVLLHLAVGAALLGINEVKNRLQDKQTMVETSSQTEEPLILPDDEQDELRYALIGLILSTPKILNRGASRVSQAANAGLTRVSVLLRPVTSSRAFRPINDRFDQMVARGEHIVYDWMEAGRRGEKTSQAMLQETTDEVVGDVVNMLAKRPEITELVQQQSIGMAEDLTDQLQGRTAAADTILERIIFSLIPGKNKDTTPTLVIPIPEEEQARYKPQTAKKTS